MSHVKPCVESCCNPFFRLSISDYIQSKEHIQLAHDMATQTMVLLKNDQSKGLPITSPYKKACVSEQCKRSPLHLYKLGVIWQYVHT